MQLYHDQKIKSDAEKNTRLRKVRFLKSGAMLLFLLAMMSSAEVSANRSTDRTVTQEVRHVLIDDSELSTDAKNIKIKTFRGVVTLRGLVSSQDKINEIVRKAQDIAGKDKVVNHLKMPTTKGE